MGTGYRVFIVLENDTLQKVAQRIYEGLRRGDEQLPRYAGKSVRFARVFYETANRRPVALIEIGTPRHRNGWGAREDAQFLGT